MTIRPPASVRPRSRTARGAPAALLLAVLLELALCAGARAQDLDSVPVGDLVAAHLGFLASDAMGGRETGTPHGDITAAYIASIFRAAGLQPAGDPGSYLQAYELQTAQLDREGAALVLREPGGQQAFALGEDFAVRVAGSGSAVTAGVVFVGYGLVDADQGLDDYAGLDVTGRVVLALNGAPQGKRAPGSSRERRRLAEAHGAAGLIMVLDSDDRRGQMFFNYMVSDMDRRSMTLASDSEPGFAYAMVKRAVAARITAAGGLDLEAASDAAHAGKAVGRVLADVSLALAAPVTIERITAHNAAGLLPGSDPELAHEVIVLSAHMDHIGIDADGVVNNGADDNASGTATLLTTAALLAANPAPRRSVLFLAVSGEEKGLLGSEYWVAHPTLDIARVIADVNIDMVGRNAPGIIGATPSPDHPEYNTLVPLASALAPDQGLTIEWETGEGKLRRRVDEYYGRSDHANFSKVGIPVVFFFSGEHEDYHRPSDTLEKIDQQKVGNMVRFTSRLLTTVGNADDRPVKLAP